MLIQNIHVKNFRSILDESLPCDSLTALVGRNGSGKSSFLSALELFYNPTARVTEEDFYAEDVTQDIEIAVTYTDLSAEAKKFFAAYIDNDSLMVVRVFSDPQSEDQAATTECVFRIPISLPSETPAPPWLSGTSTTRLGSRRSTHY